MFGEYQTIFFLIYFFILLFINISYLVEHRKVQKELQQITKDDVDIKVESLAVIFFTLLFAFFRSWLFYLIAYNITGNKFIIVLLAIFIIMDSYHAIFNVSVEQIKRSHIVLYRTIADTIMIGGFTIYYMLFVVL